MDRFRIYTDIIIDNIEGGFVDHPDDPGGATKYGITERVARQHGYNGSMRDLPREVAIGIYKKSYWDGKIMDSIKNNLAFHIYDASINHGYSGAIKILQNSLGLTADGVLGPKTYNAISAEPESMLISKFCVQRMYFYSKLKQYSVFGLGWRNRLFILLSVNWRDYA